MSLLSRKARYALHGLAYIAVTGDGEAVSFDEVLSYLRTSSPRLALSQSYIAKIFQEISRAGFTVALSGPRGGYQLARPADRIRLLDVVESVDGPLESDCCLLSVGPCSRQPACGFRGIMQEAEQAFFEVMKKETLASLAKKMGVEPVRGGKRRRHRG